MAAPRGRTNGPAGRDPMSAEPMEAPEPDRTVPVYDERGNVRPYGYPGARPLSYNERVRIAARLAKGEDIQPSASDPEKVQDAGTEPR
ncbi:MAG: hypothetical protein ACRCY8_13515 [Dermatophilaceae bacterium]